MKGARGAERRLRRSGSILLRSGAAILALTLSACAGLQLDPPGPESHAIPASAFTTLGRLTQTSLPFEGATGFALMPGGAEALAARLTLVGTAQESVDLQYYELANDATGRQLIGALVAAARRGVRIRLLLDDSGTVGSDDLLLGLSGEPNVEVRLFNPFVVGRYAAFTRLFGFLGEFSRLNARMHNKLLVADGAVAIVGGRNIADAYFGRGEGPVFLDIDVLVAGAAIRPLSTIVDGYWNSRFVFPVERLAWRGRVTGTPPDSDGLLFDGPQSAAASSPAADLGGILQRLRWGWAAAFSDSPGKHVGDNGLLGHAPRGDAHNVRELIWLEMAQAREEYTILSPYVVPSEAGMAQVRRNRARGVAVTILTNSLAATDEVAVHGAYRRYRTPLLQLDVALYELSSSGSDALADLLGPARQRIKLHAKAVVFDRDTVFLGSLNFDPRSTSTNTEIGLFIRSEEFALDVLELLERIKLDGAYRVTLDHEQRLRWRSPAHGTVFTMEPEAGGARRLLLNLFGPLVPEWLL